MSWNRAIVATAGWVMLRAASGVAAEGPDLHSLSVRVRVGGQRVIGVEQPERFEEIDLAANWRFPWSRYGTKGWGTEARFLTSIGWLSGARHDALVLSALPLLAFCSEDGRFTVGAGAGLAVLSRHRFEQQDLGGYLQGALTFGASVPVYRRLGLGYRFVHFSDAAVYGQDTIGADFHMAEFAYRF
jgi:hypothetical protein